MRLPHRGLHPLLAMTTTVIPRERSEKWESHLIPCAQAPNEIATSGASPPPRNDGSGEDGFSINSDQSEIDRRRAGYIRPRDPLRKPPGYSGKHKNPFTEEDEIFQEEKTVFTLCILLAALFAMIPGGEMAAAGKLGGCRAVAHKESVQYDTVSRELGTRITTHNITILYEDRFVYSRRALRAAFPRQLRKPTPAAPKAAKEKSWE